MAAKESVQIRTYGNWKRPTSPGILGLGIVGTAILAAHLILSVLVFMSSVQLGILWFIIGGILMYIVVRKDKHNNSILFHFLIKFNFKRQEAARRNIYVAGPLSAIPEGHFRLPSVASNIALVTYLTPSGREVGVLIHNNRYFTIVLQSEPEGSQLVDQEVVDLQVARYGQFLNSLSDEVGLHTVTVTLESEPENGLHLRREVLGHIDENASEFAKQTMQEIVENYPVNSSSINSYVALTYSMAELKADRRQIEDILHDIVARVPLFGSQLEASGAGVSKPMKADEIYKLIRTAYSPEIKNIFDLAENKQEQEVVVDWNNVGPSVAVNKWDHYISDNYIHKSYVMSQPPRGEVASTILVRLLQPHSEFLRKRITLLYRPMKFEQSSASVEADLTNALFKANSEKRPSAREQMAVLQAKQTAVEEARGANLVRFGMIATITLKDSSDLNTADALLSNLSAGSHIVLRSADGTQDTSFIAGLPLGVPIEYYYSAFDSIKDMI